VAVVVTVNRVPSVSRSAQALPKPGWAVFDIQ
jgi:hypothetical protein